CIPIWKPNEVREQEIDLENYETLHWLERLDMEMIREILNIISYFTTEKLKAVNCHVSLSHVSHICEIRNPGRSFYVIGILIYFDDYDRLVASNISEPSSFEGGNLQIAIEEDEAYEKDKEGEENEEDKENEKNGDNEIRSEQRRQT
ncbi:hypothetical protein ILUMI_03393, partial [Ignelater luminosus]